MPRMKLDRAIAGFDTVLRTLTSTAQSRRPFPSKAADNIEQDPASRKESGRLMRVNHCGEVCAQALYLGQGLTSRQTKTKEALHKAAEEETDHLAWCTERLRELDTSTSYLNPAFFCMSFVTGALVGLIGDRINLGFVAATEEQVVKHLDNHLVMMPAADLRSREILKQMRRDETKHLNSAIKQGASHLPGAMKNIMSFASKVMTRSTYWL